MERVVVLEQETANASGDINRLTSQYTANKDRLEGVRTSFIRHQTNFQ